MPPSAGRREQDPPSLLDNLGNEITGIAFPVASCMLITVFLVRVLNPEGASNTTTIHMASAAYDESSHPDASAGEKLWGAILNALVFISLVVVMTFVLFLLFKYGCYRCINAYMAVSVFDIFFLITGLLAIQLLQKAGVHVDWFSFTFLLYNFSVIGVMGILFVPIPLLLKQSYTVWVGVVVAYVFTWVPDWTSWVLLVAMALYDIAAVLMPGGPLKLLVELAMERQQALPALIYESRPSAGGYRGPGHWADRRGGGGAAAAAPSGNGSAGAAAAAAAAGVDPEQPQQQLMARPLLSQPQQAVARQPQAVARQQQEQQLHVVVTAHPAPPAAPAPPPPAPPPPPASVQEGQEDRAAGAGDPLTAEAGQEAATATGAVLQADGGPLAAAEGPAVPDTADVQQQEQGQQQQRGREDEAEPLLGAPRGSLEVLGLQQAALQASSGVPAAAAPARQQQQRQQQQRQRQRRGHGSAAPEASDVEQPLLSPEEREDRGAEAGPVALEEPVATSGQARSPSRQQQQAVAQGQQQAVAHQQEAVASSDDDGEPDIDGIKLGLGDFIFYSMLVGKASQHDMMAVFASFMGILAGLALTLLCLGVFRQALPALPFSIALGVGFYFLCISLLEPFSVSLFTHAIVM